MELVYIGKVIVYVLLISWLTIRVVKWVKYKMAFNKLLKCIEFNIKDDITYTVDYNINGGKHFNVLLLPNNQTGNKHRIQYNRVHDTVILNNNGYRTLIRMYSYNKKSSNHVIDELLKIVQELTK